MKSKLTQEKSSFVGRQLTTLMENNDLASSFTQLERGCGPEYKETIDHYRRLFDARVDAKTDAKLSGPTDFLSRFAGRENFDGRDFFRHYSRFYDEWLVVLQTFWAGASGLVNYLASVAVIALVVISIFAIYVMPAFHEMFETFGGELPEFTRIVFGLGGSLHIIAAIIAAMVVGAAVWFVRMMRRRFHAMQPLPTIPDAVPLVGRLSRVYNYVLFLNVADILRRAGVSLQDAVTSAADYANQSSQLRYDQLMQQPGDDEPLEPIKELRIAAGLGMLAEEIAQQKERQVGTLAKQLVHVRETFGLFLKLFLYVLLGSLIIAMYLPIFKMGSIV